MMFASNSLARQKEGAQGEQEEDEEAGSRRKRCLTGTAMLGTDAPWVQLGQGCRIRGTAENMDDGVGYYSTGGAEGARYQSYPVTI